VRDSVLARRHRLGHRPRRCLGFLSIAPGGLPLAVLQALQPRAEAAVAAALASPLVERHDKS
jgi:hypothetical protein